MTSYALKISTKEVSKNLFLTLVFIYFLTLSGDMLEIDFTAFSIKLPRLLGITLLLSLFLSNRFRLMGKSFFYCFLWIFGSFLVSSCLSEAFLASLGGCGAGLIAYLCFFLVPINLMRLFGKERILRLYFASFVCVGLHAVLQCVLSCFWILEPFATQTIGSLNIVRGQSWLYEPSYYALFTTPFVFFLNTRFLLDGRPRLFYLLCANLFLLISTSTGGFFAYFIFCLLCLCLSFMPLVQRYFPNLRRRVIGFLLSFLICIGALSLVLKELFLHTFFKFFYFGLLMHSSFADRYAKIIECWEIFCSSPLFGIGLRNIEHHLYTRAHFDEGVYLNEAFKWKELFHHYTATNVLMEMLASLGVLGLCGFILLFIVTIRLFCSTIRDARVALEEKKMLFSLLLSMIVMLICLQFNQELFRTYVWAHMGISVGYLLQVRASSLSLKPSF
jgi:O-antigen ligase